jgi:hypothetical protein
MSSSWDPELPPDPDDESPDFETPSEEDVLALIKENFAEDEKVTGEMSESTFDEIKKFFEDLNIKGAEEITYQEVELLWHQLLKTTSLVKDYTYTIMDLKRALRYSIYPLAISTDELLEYTPALSNPETVRPHLIQKTSGALQQLDLDRPVYVELAFQDDDGPKKTAEAIRFLGWLVNQPFLSDLPAAKDEFIEKYEPDQIVVTDLMSIAFMAVSKHLTLLEKRTPGYREEFSVESLAREQAHDEALTAIRGIYRMCGIMFMDRRRT